MFRAPSGITEEMLRAYATGRAVAEFVKHAPKPAIPTDLLDELKRIFPSHEALNNYRQDPYVGG